MRRTYHYSFFLLYWVPRKDTQRIRSHKAGHHSPVHPSPRSRSLSHHGIRLLDLRGVVFLEQLMEDENFIIKKIKSYCHLIFFFIIIKFFHSLIVTFKQPRKDMKSRGGFKMGIIKLQHGIVRWQTKYT